VKQQETQLSLTNRATHLFDVADPHVPRPIYVTTPKFGRSRSNRVRIRMGCGSLGPRFLGMEGVADLLLKTSLLPYVLAHMGDLVVIRRV